MKRVDVHVYFQEFHEKIDLKNEFIRELFDNRRGREIGNNETYPKKIINNMTIMYVADLFTTFIK